MLGGVIGTILLPPIGGIWPRPWWYCCSNIYTERNQQSPAYSRLLIGWGASFVVRFLVGLAMIGLWVVWALNR